MTRRYPDFSVPAPQPWTWVDTVLSGLAFLIVLTMLVIGVVLLFMIAPAKAHDSWVNQGGYKNPAGEWCCGDYDCKAYKEASSNAHGWMLDGELVPYDEAMPVVPPDGQVTVCRRPDGTRRCVFGVKPGL